MAKVLKLNKVLNEGKLTKLVVEHKDLIARFGVKYIELICHHIDCELIILNKPENDKEDLIQDFVSVITSFCARIYGQRRNKRKTEKLIKELTHEQKEKKSKKPKGLHKSINNIKLELANTGKLNLLNELGDAYLTLCQNDIDYIFDNEVKNVSRYGNLPDIHSELSERYKRCAWQQAAGIMKSFYANNRENKPILKNIKIQGLNISLSDSGN